MKENTNKAIAVNSIITYAKIFITAVLGLFTTRYALIVLGVDDYGLFSLFGGLISILSMINAIMVTTCNRYLSVAIGKGDLEEINKVFNVNLVLFLSCSVILLLVGLPVGLWYISRFVNYNGPINNAYMVYVLSLFGAILSTLALPFQGLLMAKERFFMFSVVSVLIHIIRFVVVLILMYHFENKLLIYTLLITITAILPVFIYWFYCKRKFPEIVKWSPVREKNIYKDIFGFSGWVAYGGIAMFARNQGSALLINAFFNTVMNTALGLAQTVNSYVTMFANSLTQPIQPQITKSYAAGNYSRTDDLLVMSTKFSFMLMLLVGTPFFIEGEWILHLWLGVVPPYVVSFTILLIIDNLVLSFNSGLSPVIFADGRIALYQILVNTLRLFAVVAAFFALKAGYEPQSLFYCYIAFSVIVVFATQYCMHKTLKYDMRRVFKASYLRSFVITLLMLPVLLVPKFCHPLLHIIITVLYLVTIEFFIGLNSNERKQIYSFCKNRTILHKRTI